MRPPDNLILQPTLPKSGRILVAPIFSRRRLSGALDSFQAVEEQATVPNSGAKALNTYYGAFGAFVQSV